MRVRPLHLRIGTVSGALLISVVWHGLDVTLVEFFSIFMDLLPEGVSQLRSALAVHWRMLILLLLLGLLVLPTHGVRNSQSLTVAKLSH